MGKSPPPTREEDRDEPNGMVRASTAAAEEGDESARAAGLAAMNNLPSLTASPAKQWHQMLGVGVGGCSIGALLAQPIAQPMSPTVAVVVIVLGCFGFLAALLMHVERTLAMRLAHQHQAQRVRESDRHQVRRDREAIYTLVAKMRREQQLLEMQREAAERSARSAALEAERQFVLQREGAERAAKHELKLLEAQRAEAERRDKADARRELQAQNTQAEEHKLQHALITFGGGEIVRADGAKLSMQSRHPNDGVIVPTMITLSGSPRAPVIPPIVKGPQS